MNNFPKKRTNPFETPIKAPKEEKVEKEKFTSTRVFK